VQKKVGSAVNVIGARMLSKKIFRFSDPKRNYKCFGFEKKINLPRYHTRVLGCFRNCTLILFLTSSLRHGSAFRAHAPRALILWPKRMTASLQSL